MVIEGGDGDDALFWRSLLRHSCRGGGNDYLVGQLGDDEIAGGTGADVLYGNLGASGGYRWQVTGDVQFANRLPLDRDFGSL